MRIVRDFRGIKILTQKAKEVLPYSLAVGQVTQIHDESTREVKVLKMEINDYLKMYFNKSYQLLSVDEKNSSKVGDIVLVKKLDNPPTNTKLFEIEKILFKIDNIVDPITGRSNNYESDILKQFLDQLTQERTKN